MRGRWWAAWCLAYLLGCERSLPVAEAPVCLLSERTEEITVLGINPLDLLIVLDVSPSMADEQATLERELPALIRMLVTGKLRDGTDAYPPIRDLRIGVVSADLGAGATAGGVQGCTTQGDDARLARGAACGGERASYADYFAPKPTLHPLVPAPSREAEDALVEDVMCRVRLRSAGCGVSQSLEATLRAFQANPEFQHVAPGRFLSALHVLLISDGDDCSLREGEAAALAAGPGDPTCLDRDGALHEVERFVNGLRALRPGNEDRVTMSAIVGLPPGFTHAPVGWGADREREEFYAQLLADPRMQAQLGPDGTLASVCESEHARATPAPRIVEAVRGLGRSGAVLSICEGDWTAALTPMLEATSPRADALCLLESPRASNGLTACRMLWTLPLPEHAPRGTPTRCDDLPFLAPYTEHPSDELGHPVCEVHQLRVEGQGADRRLEPGGGWFYDPLSEYRSECICPSGPRCGSLVFVPNQPSGGAVRLTCFESHYALPTDGTLAETVEQPDFLDPCAPDDPRACARRLEDPRGGAAQDGLDHRLRCDRALRQCVLPCEGGSCPAGWSCSAEETCEPGECRVPG